MHWPIAFKHDENMKIVYNEDGTPQLDEELSKNHIYTYEAMENCVRTKKALHIGVSNFSIKRLEELLEYAEIPPVANQVEAHPYLPQRELLEFCKKHHILLQAYSPLGSQRTAGYEPGRPAVLLEDETINQIAEKYSVSPAQVLIAWASMYHFLSTSRYCETNTSKVQRGTSPLPKSATPKRIRQNFEFVELSPEDFKAIDEITDKDPSKKHRYVCFNKKWGVKKIGIDSIWEY